MALTFDSFFSRETLHTEFKEFALNNCKRFFSLSECEDYCTYYKFNFNKEVLYIIKKYFKIYIPKYASSFWNAQISGNLYIGINDLGFIKGIPFQSELSIELLNQIIQKIIIKYLDAKYINFINIELIKINKPEKPREKSIPSMKEYFENKEKFLQEKQKFKNNLLNWRIRMLYMTQKLVDLVNNQDSRESIINYIKNINPDNIVIKLLETDYKLLYASHEEIKIYKDDINNIFYWITRWRDDMVDKIKLEKPIFNCEFLDYNLPINLLLSSYTLIPYWMNYNDNMNLYVIKINFIFPNIYHNIKYYDKYLKKWIKKIRIVDKKNINQKLNSLLNNFDNEPNEKRSFSLATLGKKSKIFLPNEPMCIKYN
jgi:hypothetical protein